MKNKGLPFKLALVVILLFMHTLRKLFPDSWALGFWALLVDLLILVAIILEIVIRWKVNRSHESTDWKVIELLEHDPFHWKSIEEITALTDISKRKLEASLRRLTKTRQVAFFGGRWRKTVF